MEGSTTLLSFINFQDFLSKYNAFFPNTYIKFVTFVKVFASYIIKSLLSALCAPYVRLKSAVNVQSIRTLYTDAISSSPFTLRL